MRNIRPISIPPAENRNMNNGIGIPNHAVFYALLVKAVYEQMHEGEAEALIEAFTVFYGRIRGMRMRSNADRLQYGCGLSAWFLTSEWRGEENENISKLKRSRGEAVTSVEKCGWYLTWKKYGLLNYGTQYCRWIDRAIATGFAGSFTLSIPETKAKGDKICRFVYAEREDAEEPIDAKESLVRPFSFHCRELLECAESVLSLNAPKQAALILNQAKREYRRIFPEAACCFWPEDGSGQ